MANPSLDIPQLKQHANAIRQHIVRMVHAAGSGHPGGALGITDVLTYLYFVDMQVDPTDPADPQRDRFVLSPGHMVPGLYATLAQRGFFPTDELLSFRHTNSRLQGHTYRNLELGVETTGGSLAQGLSVAIGFALAARLREQRNETAYRTYCLISDGELNEGQTWEALMFAAREKLHHLTVFLDVNGIQLSNHAQALMPTEPIVDKLRAFNWNVLEVDGHDFQQLAFATAKARLAYDHATIIVLRTTAGKGVSFMEGKWEWHGKAPSDAELAQALQDLQGND